MDTKSLNLESNPLSEKIIKTERNSFKLWLEFEVAGPFNEVENNFANIAVNTLDGRNYGINVWTYQFLKTAEKEDLKKGKCNYIIPPDLFVKELTRECIEETISELLNQGNLEDLLSK